MGEVRYLGLEMAAREERFAMEALRAQRVRRSR